jgi:DNA-binding NtrC family response regulator
LIEAVATKKVFVVDEDKLVADVSSGFLRKAEFNVETFYDAQSALLRVGDRSPDVLVTDISTPEMGSITLAEALLKQNPRCKVILVSDSAHWQAQRQLEANDPYHFVLLSKPFPLSQLLHLIRSEESACGKALTISATACTSHLKGETDS